MLRSRGDKHQPTCRRIYAGPYLLGTATKLRIPNGRGRHAWRWFVRPASTAWNGDVTDSLRGDPALAELGPFVAFVDAQVNLVVHLRTHGAEGVAQLYPAQP